LLQNNSVTMTSLCLAADRHDVLDGQRRMFGQKPVATRQHLNAVVLARLRFNYAVEVVRPKHVLQGMLGLLVEGVESLCVIANSKLRTSAQVTAS
jgi:hypothetical protein